MIRRLSLAAGPLALALALLVPAPGLLSAASWRVAGLAVWMALWWLTAVVPLPVTALVPLAVLPLLGVTPVAEVAASYADPIIFLFLGGFLLAATLERWGLHRRFALATVRLVGSGDRRMVLAFMLVSAFVSMWISNTATAVMMLPIAAAVAAPTVGHPADRPTDGFPTALMLAVAYGASIGGVATLIGTPPNAILAANARELIGRDLSFAGWMPIGLSVAIPMLIGCWGILVWMFGIPRTDVAGDARAARVSDQNGRTSGGPFVRGERFVLGVFVVTALAWILRTPKAIGPIRVPGLADALPGISDTGIAIAAAIVLFVVPLRGARFRVALDWDTARTIPWGILLLFGGGLALASAFQSSGLSEWVGGRLGVLAGLPFPVVIATTAALFVFLTELTSNTATAALGMPLMAGVAGGLGVAPFAVMAAAALASSMAFMLPVATPPNAIVFGKGLIRASDMARAGLVMNLLAIVTISVVVSLVL